MTMTIWQGALTIVTVVLGTMCTRFLPFLVFPESKQPPRIIEYFGQVLPYAMTGLLVVYALRNTPILTGSHDLPELIACTVIVLLHGWKRNMLLSIAGGTIIYICCWCNWCSEAPDSLVSPSASLCSAPPLQREVIFCTFL